MRKNACGLDRVARLVTGIALVALGLGTSGGLRGRNEDVARWQILATFAGAELLVTGLLQWCPGSYLLGISTCPGGQSRLATGGDEDADVERSGGRGVVARARAGLPVG